MQAKTYLKDYIKKTQPILNSFFKQQEKEAAEISPITKEMIMIYHHFMGGKNIRGALTKLGYECYGGQNEKAILEVSLMAEITHAFFLIHDDVMDQDSLRRGKPTIHVQYENLYKNSYQGKNAAHYGESMAINLGDVGFTLSHFLLSQADFSDEIKIKVLKHFEEILLKTAYGQALDISYELKKKLKSKDIFKIHRYKTANYTITGPLQYGALFAQADEKRIKKIENYGLPVGIAFQLRDDELGLFADERVLGKPIGSDVKENKNTLLHLKALEWAKGKERKFIKSAYGNKGLTQKELNQVRKITRESGALAYSQNLARKLVDKGKKSIFQITKNPKYASTLANMADFMIERES
jgi:geranylgeranyl diphosphate synthase type I